MDTELSVCTSGPNVLITSRKPDDLPAFCSKLVEVFSQPGRARSAAWPAGDRGAGESPAADDAD